MTLVTDEMLHEKQDLINEFRTEKYGDVNFVYFICEPGKFEGHCLSSVYYYNKALEGISDGEIDLSLPAAEEEDEWLESDGPLASYFELDESDWELWPELFGEKYIGVWTDDYGFLRVIGGEEVARLLEEDTAA